MKILHKPSGQIFDNRKEAKLGLGGTSKFNKANKNGEIEYINTDK